MLSAAKTVCMRLTPIGPYFLLKFILVHPGAFNGVLGVFEGRHFTAGRSTVIGRGNEQDHRVNIRLRAPSVAAKTCVSSELGQGVATL
jgi:hypothetical protein